MSSKKLQEQDRINSAKRWKNRRRMAWISLFAILIVTYYMMFKIEVERITALEQVITWFYTVMGSIIASYVGFATFDDVKTMEKEKE
jgi:hypothetical protein